MTNINEICFVQPSFGCELYPPVISVYLLRSFCEQVSNIKDSFSLFGDSVNLNWGDRNHGKYRVKNYEVPILDINYQNSIESYMRKKVREQYLKLLPVAPTTPPSDPEEFQDSPLTPFSPNPSFVKYF
jgi:hypothetical protein